MRKNNENIRFKVQIMGKLLKYEIKSPNNEGQWWKYFIKSKKLCDKRSILWENNENKC